MPGLGSSTAKQLATGGILTLGQLRKANLEEVMTDILTEDFICTISALLPNGDLFQSLSPIRSPFSILGLRTREKSVQPPSNVDYLITSTCDNTN